MEVIGQYEYNINGNKPQIQVVLESQKIANFDKKNDMSKSNLSDCLLSHVYYVF